MMQPRSWIGRFRSCTEVDSRDAGAVDVGWELQVSPREFLSVPKQGAPAALGGGLLPELVGHAVVTPN